MQLFRVHAFIDSRLICYHVFLHIVTGPARCHLFDWFSSPDSARCRLRLCVTLFVDWFGLHVYVCRLVCCLVCLWLFTVSFRISFALHLFCLRLRFVVTPFTVYPLLLHFVITFDSRLQLFDFALITLLIPHVGLLRWRFWCVTFGYRVLLFCYRYAVDAFLRFVVHRCWFVYVRRLRLVRYRLLLRFPRVVRCYVRYVCCVTLRCLLLVVGFALLRARLPYLRVPVYVVVVCCVLFLPRIIPVLRSFAVILFSAFALYRTFYCYVLLFSRILIVCTFYRCRLPFVLDCLPADCYAFYDSFTLLLILFRLFCSLIDSFRLRCYVTPAFWLFAFTRLTLFSRCVDFTTFTFTHGLRFHRTVYTFPVARYATHVTLRLILILRLRLRLFVLIFRCVYTARHHTFVLIRCTFTRYRTCVCFPFVAVCVAARLRCCWLR